MHLHRRRRLQSEHHQPSGVLIALAVTVLIVVGIKESANVNSVIVVIKVAVVLIVILGGAAFVNSANWQPFIPPNTGTFGEYGWSGVLRGAGVIFFAYIGFDAVSVAAQEAKNPQKDMPIGILGSLVGLHDPLRPGVGVMVGLVPYQRDARIAGADGRRDSRSGAGVGRQLRCCAR